MKWWLKRKDFACCYSIYKVKVFFQLSLHSLSFSIFHWLKNENWIFFYILKEHWFGLLFNPMINDQLSTIDDDMNKITFNQFQIFFFWFDEMKWNVKKIEWEKIQCFIFKEKQKSWQNVFPTTKWSRARVWVRNTCVLMTVITIDNNDNDDG